MIKLTKSKYFYKLMLLAAALIWGSSFVVLKMPLSNFPVAFILAVRFGIAFLLLFFFNIKNFKNINKKTVIGGILIGCAMIFSLILQNSGLKHTTPSKNAFLTASYCIIVPFIFYFIKISKPDRYNIIAAVLCLIGISLISLTGNFKVETGDLLSLAGGVFIALQIVLIFLFSKGTQLISMITLQFATGTVIALLMHLLFESPPPITSYNSGVIFSIFYVAIFCTLITMSFQNIGQKYTNPTEASIILSFEAVFATIFSVIFYKENLTLLMYLGFAAIFLSVIISETKLSFIFKKNK